MGQARPPGNRAENGPTLYSVPCHADWRPARSHSSICAGAHDPADAWEWWHRVRCLCGHNAKLGVLLDLPLTLPPEQYVTRWRVRAALLCSGSILLGAPLS